jgi:hypothetical protein
METFSLRDYLNRWQLVASIELKERKAETINRRWQLVNYLYNLANSLELPQEDSHEDNVWQRWATLKGVK